ncbi:NAD-dependent epimerase/dehydratase family protein [Lysinibacillus telephonicus]|uniref:NAD-dependent epimerase/dehydratase family protein n=1 Tax=Lysinibacillus telephonicus TaxID=1714840 RepID=UPI003BA3B507
MKITITGVNGYISNSISTWLSKKSQLFDINLISIRDEITLPNNTDVLIHTAALVHKKESNFLESDYFKVNCDLTVQLAKKAKISGVKHFIFFSTMAVYGIESGEIHSKSVLQPKTFYGKSKLAAEKQLLDLKDDNFIVSIVRPPMVYGPKCPGNYAILEKVARKTPIFPNVKNFRSMIFIYNLTEFIYQLILHKALGIFHPQDSQYVTTSQMVKKIAEIHHHPLFLEPISGSFIKPFCSRIGIVNKVFGNLVYNKDLSSYMDNSYQIYSFEEALKITELSQ